MTASTTRRPHDGASHSREALPTQAASLKLNFDQLTQIVAGNGGNSGGGGYRPKPRPGEQTEG